jgi:hypothetical protein
MPDGWASIRLKDGVADRHCLPIQVKRFTPMRMREWYLFDLASPDSATSTRPLARYKDVSLSLAYDPDSMAMVIHGVIRQAKGFRYSEMTRASGRSGVSSEQMYSRNIRRHWSVCRPY